MPLTIAEQLVQLAELARVDHKQKVTADRLEALPAAAKKADAQALKIKVELDSVAARKATAEQVKRGAEAEIADNRAKLRKWEARANDIRGEREHAALSSEIGGAKRHVRELEDVVLEQMQTIETADKDAATLQKKYASTVDDARGEWQKVEGDLAVMRTEVDATRTQRQAILAVLPPLVVRRYEQIAAKKQGVGVAILSMKDTCGACNRIVPPQMCIQVMKGQVLESCPACMRILVHHSQAQGQNPASEASNG